MFNELFQILHLADSAFPVGGFAYSAGLEFAVKSGIISDIDGFKSYLHAFCTQMQQFDLCFTKAAYGASEPDLCHLSQEYNAMLLNPPIKKAGLVLGKNWLRISKQIYGEQTVAWPANIDNDFLLVFGFTAQQMGLSLLQCCTLFLYMAVRDQVSAAIRLGTIGPSLAHQIQHQLLTEISKNLHIDAIPAIDKAHKTAYLLELAQLSHKNLYTKLFQN